ncbi:MAG: UGMP family protein, partial [Candidatus Methanomethylophilaceae archaeon]|nr:UGMP family protein [Candidatus Methanomethylophilaceae archaeon]
MIILGIEGTAHTFGAGIVDSEHNVLANEIDMFRPAEGGLHPREVANHHSETAAPVIKKAL